MNQKFEQKNISCECKCRFDGKNVIQINDGITINIYVSVKTSCNSKRLYLKSCYM